MYKANRPSDRELDKRIFEGKKVIGLLNTVFWSTKIIGITKRKIYSTIFQSIVLYGSKTRALKKRQKDRLLALEMDFWRRSAEKSRQERAHNETIRITMNVKKNVQITEEKLLGWFSYDIRMRDFQDLYLSGNLKVGKEEDPGNHGYLMLKRQYQIIDN